VAPPTRAGIISRCVAPQPNKDRAWFERKVGELGAKLDKLPRDRQEQLEQELPHGGRR
jgi:hypothetical protein